MKETIGIIVAIAAVAFFVWMLLGKTKGPTEDIVIDPDDPRQIGLLIGMRGGNIADAVVVKFALERFEKEHGRKATMRDIGIVAGMMRAGR